MKTIEDNRSVASGGFSLKIHVWNGSKTLCNSKALNTESKVKFAESFAKYPESCCTKCAKKIKLI